ncbi:MAG: hypothetical protein E6R03_16390 [Hyphomicrobiaceae bacterium]|nr:MAG: hypothetical protein E6R03_16390 [Hyphomicrobiaceae bacterium]
MAVRLGSEKIQVRLASRTRTANPTDVPDWQRHVVWWIERAYQRADQTKNSHAGGKGSDASEGDPDDWEAFQKELGDVFKETLEKVMELTRNHDTPGGKGKFSPQVLKNLKEFLDRIKRLPPWTRDYIREPAQALTGYVVEAFQLAQAGDRNPQR